MLVFLIAGIFSMSTPAECNKVPNEHNKVTMVLFEKQEITKEGVKQSLENNHLKKLSSIIKNKWEKSEKFHKSDRSSEGSF